MKIWVFGITFAVYACILIQNSSADGPSWNYQKGNPTENCLVLSAPNDGVISKPLIYFDVNPMVGATNWHTNYKFISKRLLGDENDKFVSEIKVFDVRKKIDYGCTCGLPIYGMMHTNGLIYVNTNRIGLSSLLSEIGLAGQYSNSAFVIVVSNSNVLFWDFQVTESQFSKGISSAIKEIRSYERIAVCVYWFLDTSESRRLVKTISKNFKSLIADRFLEFKFTTKLLGND